LEIETTRFGLLQVQDDQIISVPSGILGFPEDKRYILFNHQDGSPFLWFQSIDHGGLAFVLIDPFLFKPDYEVQLSPEDCSVLELENGNEGLQGIQPLSIVNISRGEPKVITANLLGPVVFNLKKRLAKQVILDQKNYSHRFPIPLAKDEKSPIMRR
jgi:flagellar assembly factor FliW